MKLGKFEYKKWLAAFPLLLGGMSQAYGCGSYSGTTGFTTPTEIQVPLNSISLIPAGSTNPTSIWSGSQVLDFKRSSGNFANASIGSASVQPGRYTGVSWTGLGTWSVKLDGTLYTGNSVGGFTGGTSHLYTTGTDARNSSIATSGTAVMASDLGVPGTGGGASGFTNYFPQTLCIAGSGVTCQSTDITFDPTKTPIHITFIMDLYNTVLVDASSCALAYSANSYPAIVMGDAGAAVHVSGSNANGFTEGTLLFDNNSGSLGGGPRLVYGSFFSVGNGPSGLPFVGNQAWGLYTKSSGEVQFPLGDCLTGACLSRGGAQLSNVTQAAGSTLAFNCVTETAGLYGAGYPAPSQGQCASGENNMASALKVARVVDPSGILGSCPSGAATQLTGSPGTCVATNPSGDGYP